MNARKKKSKACMSMTLKKNDALDRSLEERWHRVNMKE